MGKLIDAAASGDRLQGLKELRDMISLRLETTNSARDIASLSLRLMQCYEEIQAIEDEQKKEVQREGRPLEELRRRFLQE